MKEPLVQPTHVTITNRCETVPKKVSLGPGDQVDFHCGANNAFGLLLTGMVFEGHDKDFVLVVDGPSFVPVPPLQVRQLKPGVTYTIHDYVYDRTGSNCIVKDPPPEIIIGG